MNSIILFCFGIVIVVCQTSVFRVLAVPYLKAPLILSVVIYGAFYMEPVRALILAFILGYAADVYSGGIQGVTPMVMLLLCMIGQWMSRGIFVEGKLALGLVAFGFGLAHNFLYMGMEALVGGGGLQKSIDLSNLLLQSMIVAVGCPILVSLASKVDRLTTIGWRRLQGLRT